MRFPHIKPQCLLDRSGREVGGLCHASCRKCHEVGVAIEFAVFLVAKPEQPFRLEQEYAVFVGLSSNVMAPQRLESACSQGELYSNCRHRICCLERSCATQHMQIVAFRINLQEVDGSDCEAWATDLATSLPGLPVHVRSQRCSQAPAMRSAQPVLSQGPRYPVLVTSGGLNPRQARIAPNFLTKRRCRGGARFGKNSSRKARRAKPSA